MIRIDAKGRSCPEPVIILRKVLKESPESCTIEVDNAAARENCSRYGKNAGYKVEISENGGVYALTMTK